MASPLQHCSALLKKITRHGRLRQGRQRRRLLLESLERRNLLAIDSLAAITGMVFADAVADTPVESAVVDLYRDGGDGLLDRGAGGGDDLLIGSDTTDASGTYRFDNLQAGTYFVEQQPVSGLLQRPEDAVQTVVITPGDAAGVTGTTIDSFDATTQLVEDPDDMLPNQSAADTGPGEALGGERDLVVQRTSGTGRVRLSVNDLSSGFLELTTSSGAVGKGTAVWDGDDDDAATLNPTGLGGIDLTQGGANTAFHMALGADHPSVMLTLSVYTDADNWSSLTFEVADTGSATPDTSNPVLVDLADLVVQQGTGADLTNVGAIVLGIQGVVDVQLGFDDLGMIGPTLLTADFPNYEPLSLGDQVWADTDNDGIFGSGESGLEDVLVHLYEDTDGSGDFTPADQLLASDTTDADGNFLFEALFPGDYLLQVDPTNFDSGGPLAQYVSSNGNAPAPDPDADPTDGDDNGDPLAGQGVVSLAVTLAPGTEPTDDGDDDANTNLAVDFGFTPVSDLAVVKSDDPDPVVAGQELSYTLIVTNNGPADDTNVVVSDTLPPGVNFVSASVVERPSITPEHTAGTVTANIGGLASGESVTVQIVVSVNSATTELLQNTAEVSGDNFDPDPQNNTDGEDTGVETLIDLEIAKEDGTDPVHVGETLVYTLVVVNNGPSDATGVTVLDQLPAGMTLVDFSSSQGSVSQTDGLITANLGNIANGDLATIEIEVTIDADAPGTLQNTAVVSGNETETETDNNSDTSVTEVRQLVDLAIDKSVDVSTVDAGGQLVYTLIVSNNGPSAATGVTVTDTLPAGVTFVSASPEQGTANETDGVVTVDLGDLASGADAQVTITVTVDAATLGTLLNEAVVAGNEDEQTTSNNTDTASAEVNPLIDLSIQKTDNPDPVAVDGQLMYTLVVTNNGPSQATGVTLQDTLPGGVTFASATSGQGTVNHAGGVVTAELGSLASGAQTTVTITVDVASGAQGTLSNTAVVSGNEDETTTANNTATVQTTVSPRVDLAIIKADSPDPVVAGQQLTYTLSIENLGPSDATGVQVVDTLPAGVSFVSASSTVGTVSHAGGVVTVQIGDLDSDDTVVVTILVNVDPSVRGMMNNTAQVSSNETDTNPNNNRDDEPTTVQARVDLAVTKTDSIDPVAAGAQLTYTVIVSNNGPSDATSVELTDTLPDEVTFVSATSSQGTVSHAAGVVTAAIGAMDAGNSVTVTIIVQVDAQASGTITNAAEVSAAETELNAANNTAEQATVISRALSSLMGAVYVDVDNDGQRDPDEPGIAGVTIQLEGTDGTGADVSRQAVTDEDGEYVFEGLVQGTYTLHEVQPDRYVDGIDAPGSLGAGATSNDTFSEIELPAGVEAIDYLFGERAPTFSKRRFLSSR
jgi:uncharacterized repeat protein (TIGR01451 family)